MDINEKGKLIIGIGRNTDPSPQAWLAIHSCFFSIDFCVVCSGSAQALADCGFESFRKYLILIFY